MAEDGQPLEGGVASDVRVVETPDGAIVVKRALPQLKVEADWFSDPARSMIEAAAIAKFRELVGPDHAPEVLWVRPEEHLFAMTLIPPRFRNWKAELLAGQSDADTAFAVGHVLGTLHARSANDSRLPEAFGDLTYFRQLRLEPFFAHVAERRPEFADAIRRTADCLVERRTALVHGDYSPKNILADGSDVVILDFEVAHWGNPRFDVAFCLAHLMLKSSIEGRGPDMARAITAFLDGYAVTGPDVMDAELANVTGCLLLARLYGKSPVDYLDRIDRAAIEARAAQLLGAAAFAGYGDLILAL